MKAAVLNMVKLRRNRGLTLIELLVVVLILSVLVAIAIPMYMTSINDSETNSCKTNMASVAAAEQAEKVRFGGAYWTGTVDSSAAATDGPLADLHNAVPMCPGDPTDNYIVLSDGGDGFIVRCTNPRHRFQWHNGLYENY